MGLKRSRLEIYADVLTEIKSGTSLTIKIMYGTNLSWRTIKKTLKKLTAQGLIKEQTIKGCKRTKKIYTLTEKGNNALNYINKINELLKFRKPKISLSKQ